MIPFGKEVQSTSSFPSMSEPYTELGTTENQTILGVELIPH
ncbi:hypothetical protein [Bacillus sp. SRB3LM]|nr:hypothetical protein [Bacillus sp. SRB3LM]